MCLVFLSATTHLCGSVPPCRVLVCTEIGGGGEGAPRGDAPLGQAFGHPEQGLRLPDSRHLHSLKSTLFPDWQLSDWLSDLVYLFLGTELSLYLAGLSGIATGPRLYELCGRTGLAGAGVRIGVG